MAGNILYKMVMEGLSVRWYLNGKVARKISKEHYKQIGQCVQRPEKENVYEEGQGGHYGWSKRNEGKSNETSCIIIYNNYIHT